ncbi:MAG: PrgI family protein [Candidatus Peribacteraceae bacterium]|nr:PrgI family protein [Candidatus Peribacteraceae bacterium]
MAIEPVKIPQNVYVEDRIIGPVSLRQLLIVLLSGGFSYVLWTSMKSATGGVSVASTMIAWTPCVIGAAFAFVKVQGISLLRFCLLVAERIDKPSIRRWSPRRGISINIHFAGREEKPAAKVAAPRAAGFDELSSLLDRGPVPGETQAMTETPAPSPPPAEPVTAESTPRPVDPSRIAVDSPLEETDRIDDITPATEPPLEERGHNLSNIVQDIFPPSLSHG